MKLLNQTINALSGMDPKCRARAKEHLERLVMPYWALGRLMDLACDLCGITRSIRPLVDRKKIFVFAGDHGVCEEGTSLYPQEVTAQMVHNFLKSGAGINALARQSGTEIAVVDMGVLDPLEELAQEGKIFARKIRAGTSNLARYPAMTREEAVLAVETGIQIALDHDESTDVFGTGDMGIGNTTPSAAIISAATSVSPSQVAGRGSGIDEAQLEQKIAVIDRALAFHGPSPYDGLDLLSKVGGFEIGGIAGLILGSAALRRPVVIDGYISGAAALIAKSLSSRSTDFMIAGHRSAERGHSICLRHLGLDPLLDLGLRLGEGTGAALAMNVITAAASLLTEVATFSQAGVSGAES